MRLLSRSGRFFVRHLGWILGLGTIAAVGRVVQVGWAYQSALALALALEVVVEAARVGIFLVVVGAGRPGDGIAAIRAALRRSRDAADGAPAPERRRPATDRAALVAGIAVFGVFALLVNLAIGAVAGVAPVQHLARAAGFPGQDGASLRTGIVLFAKNLTIIPFTLVWLVEGLYRSLREGSPG